MLYILKILKKFFSTKRYLYFLPRNLRFKIFNIKALKLYKTLTGNYYLPRFAFKDLIRNEIIDNKIFDSQIYNTGKHYIKDNTIVLDVGSNFGQLSVLFSKYKNNVEVYSFEASRYIFTILEKNIKINRANVKLFNNLVGNQTEQDCFIEKANLCKFNTYGSNKIEILEDNIKQNYSVEKIKTLKLDDIYFDKKISLMKIDVQGHDLAVLKGARRLISEQKMPIIFEYEKDYEKDFKYSFKDFEIFINEINYFIKIKIDNSNYLILPK